MSNRILVIDDEGGIRDALRQVLEYEGWQVRTASSGGEGITICNEFHPHVVLLDVKMAGLDGLETLTRLRDLDPPATVVMISGHGTIATAVAATQRGAFDFLEKPLDTDRLLVTLRNSLQQSALAGENRELKRALDTRYPMVGTSPALEEVRALIDRVGPTHARVLITGENGSGKELVARAVHEASPRRDRAFIEVNCAAIPSELIESELFGHMKGSFTGAFADRAGKFELADGGTLFLDEVGDMSLSAQAKVLRVLQEGMVTRIGAAKSVQADVRVVAATNKDLEEEIGEGRFREDLFYRLNVVPITVPPLRERLEDIPALVEHFVATLSGGAGVAPRPVTPDAIKALSRRSWPGNVRELRNAIERLLILAAGKQITAADVERLLPVGDGGVPAGTTPEAGRAPTFEHFKQDAERVFLLSKLREHGWNVAETARALDMPRSNLYKKIEKYQLTREDSVTGPPRDWDKEMAEIDKIIAKTPVVSGQGSVARPGQAALPAAPRAAAPAPVRGGREGLFTWVKVLLGVGVAAAVALFWPYAHACGLQLYGYLAAAGGVILVGLWGVVASWQSRKALAHTLSLLAMLTGVVLVGKVLLDRTGYPKQPATWRCG